MCSLPDKTTIMLNQLKYIGLTPVIYDCLLVVDKTALVKTCNKNNSYDN